MDVPLSWERVLWSQRALLAPRNRYVLTDFRLVYVAGAKSRELAFHDIADVRRRESWIDGLLGTSTLIVRSRDQRQPPFVLAHIRHGTELAALLDLAADRRITLDPDSVRASLAWKPRARIAGYREVVLSVSAMVIAVFAVAVGLHGNAAVHYPEDDAVYPGGTKRDRDAIMRFMEADVLPWAQTTLGPLKGGAEAVTCETCHGPDPEAREWQMPAVAKLPLPEVAARGWEIYSAGMNAQTRNAIYGYVAESDNQAKAAYMREVVMPGMARLLRRPAYDFTRSYEYNRTSFAFGCYHCHRVT